VGLLAPEHVGDAAKDGAGQTTLVLAVARVLSAVVVLRLLGLAGRGEEVRSQLSDELAGGVILATAAAAAAVRTAAEELIREAAEGIAAVATTAATAGAFSAEKGVHGHALRVC